MGAAKTDIQIARKAKMKTIRKILKELDVPDKQEALSPKDRHIAKINLEYIESLNKNKNGKRVLVEEITRTPTEEGKTTTAVR